MSAPKQFKRFPVQLCPPGFKQCNVLAWAKKVVVCSKIKPLSEFHKDRHAADGYMSRCKECEEVYSKQRRTNPKTRPCVLRIGRKSGKKFYAEHRDECNAYRRQYRAEHRDEINAYSRQYYTEHRDECNAYQRQYRAEHRDEIKAHQRQYDAEHRDENKAYQRQYHIEHGDEINARKRAKRKAAREAAMT